MNIEKYGPAAPQFKLSDCKVFGHLPTSRNSVLKKVYNVAVSKLFFMEEFPITSKDSQRAVKEKLEVWDKTASYLNQLRSHSLFWNTPEGSLTVLYDYAEICPLGELHQIIECFP